MAFELVQEVLDHAPAGLGQAERLVLVCIAEEARRGSRKVGIAQSFLIHRTGLTKSGLQKVFQRLARHKVEVRIPLRTDKGRPVYAVPGTTCTYQIPALEPPKDCPCHRCLLGASASILPEKDGPEGRGRASEGVGRASEGVGQTPGGTPTSPVPPTGAHRTIGETGVADDEPRRKLRTDYPSSSMRKEDREALEQQLRQASNKHGLNGRRHENAANGLFSAALKPGEET